MARAGTRAITLPPPTASGVGSVLRRESLSLREDAYQGRGHRRPCARRRAAERLDRRAGGPKPPASPCASLAPVSHPVRRSTAVLSGRPGRARAATAVAT